MSLLPPADRLRAAGIATLALDEGTQQCLKFGARPPTPDRDRKWRTVREPGARVRHPGLREDHVDDSAVYGDFVKGSDHVADVLAHGAQKPMDAYMQQRGEAIYRSTKREPLGKSFSRGHVLPSRVTHPDYAFGIASDSSEAAKNVLFPEDEPYDPANDERYKKSHAAYAPGEQRTRAYDWAGVGIDPTTHRFGGPKPGQGGAAGGGAVRSKGEKNGVAAALNPQVDADEAPAPSRIVPKAVADHRDFAADHLGRVKNLGRGAPRRVPETFGLAPKREEGAWGAADCIRGEYEVEHQMPDKDLGKSVRPGFRNVARDPERAFGVPSIRTDIPARTSSSVTDTQNYGDAPTAGDLLNPSRFAEIGVDHEDFIESRNATEIRDIFARIGVTLDDVEFRNIWRRAASHYDLNADGIVSVEEFRLALNEYQDALDEGAPPAWFEDGAEEKDM